MIRQIAPLALALVCLAASAIAQEAEPPMTTDRLEAIIKALDPEATREGDQFQLLVEDVPVIVLTDPGNDRMRAIVPIRSADAITPDEMIRLMQSNFDTALDARYAIAKGRLWGAFIHPLSPLEKNEFISGVGQAVNLARTYGSLYTGGALSFGGGDSNALNRALIDELLEKGEKI
ncbi:hypothetical protein KHP62_13800 [Rhodobacteraceae bacterium NNCM2]|nr:hypothetical protein [Coraliihabitans acroporae]